MPSQNPLPNQTRSLIHLLRERMFLLILLANVGYYVVMVAAGVNWQSPRTLDLLRWGGNFAPLTLTGEPWRLLTSMFMHGGLLHLALNMLMLFQLGQIVEWRYGSLRFGVIYLLSGLGGGVASALWNGIHKVDVGINAAGMAAHAERLLPAVSVGASGAIMGLAGAWFVIRFSEPSDEHSSRDVKTIGQVILMNLAIGFMIKGIDQSAHIGGLLAGVTSGFLLMRIFFGARGVMGWVFPLLLGTLGTVAAIGVAALPPSNDLQAYRQQVDRELQRDRSADAPADEDPGTPP